VDRDEDKTLREQQQQQQQQQSLMDAISELKKQLMTAQ